MLEQILPGVRIIIANPETKGPLGDSHLGEVDTDVVILTRWILICDINVMEAIKCSKVKSSALCWTPPPPPSWEIPSLQIVLVSAGALSGYILERTKACWVDNLKNVNNTSMQNSEP